MSESNRFTVQWDALDPFDPSYPHLWVKVEHLGRYLFAAAMLEQERVRSVVDVACGTGYGSRELAVSADNVIAVDHGETQLSAARTRYDKHAIEFVAATLGCGEFPKAVAAVAEGSVDAVVCFETLEHIPDTVLALEEIHAVLRPGGVAIVSVPSSLSEGIDDVGLPSNRLHKRLFSISSITEMLCSTGFEIEYVLSQPLVADIARNEARLIRRKQMDGRIGAEPALHSPELIRRLALTLGLPEARDVERGYSVTIVARRETTP